jgi:hypothetical protein
MSQHRQEEKDMKSLFGKMVLASAFMAVAAFASNTAMAEANVKVPFSFTAAGKVWPAGNYTIVKQSTRDFVTLISKESSLSFTALVGPGDAAPTDTQITLRFDEVANGHALRSIQYGPMVTSRLDRKSMHSEYLTSSGR